jgi:hypothetical protein
VTRLGVQPAPVLWEPTSDRHALDGRPIMRNSRSLDSSPRNIIVRLQHRAELALAHVLFAERSGEGWRSVTCRKRYPAPSRRVG